MRKDQARPPSARPTLRKGAKRPIPTPSGRRLVVGIFGLLRLIALAVTMITIRMVMGVIIMAITFVTASLAVMFHVHVVQPQFLFKRCSIPTCGKLTDTHGCVGGIERASELLGRSAPQGRIATDGFKQVNGVAHFLPLGLVCL
jgi:hypothetical protein